MDQFGKVDLSIYDNSWYHPGRNVLVRLLWYLVNVMFFINPLIPISGIKVFLLRLFGARIGEGVVIKPAVNIKYPWNLVVGNHTWIGEKVWIDNLAPVTIGNHCCLSQGAMILNGNHDYRKHSFDLMVCPIILEDGVWIGARAMVTPGVICKSHSVLGAMSMATGELEAYSVYQGVPAVKIRERSIKEAE